MARQPLLAALFALALPSTGIAEENRLNLHLELGPLFVVSQQPHNLATDPAGFGLGGLHIRGAFEYQLNDRVGVELAYSPDFLFHHINSSAQPFQVIVVGVRGKAWYSPKGGFLLPLPELKFRKPLTIVDLISDAYVDVHAGVAISDHTYFVYDVGVGARVPIVKPIQVGLFVRWQHMIAGGSDMIMQVLAGVTLSGGGGSTHPEPDTDDDGVPDSRDRCPNTPHDARVNDAGCPFVESNTEAPKCGDSDLDGVCDGQDECPDTKAGVSVDKRGCPPQSEPAPESE